jgi:hypothetical protein
MAAQQKPAVTRTVVSGWLLAGLQRPARATAGILGGCSVGPEEHPFSPLQRGECGPGDNRAIGMRQHSCTQKMAVPILS